MKQIKSFQKIDLKNLKKLQPAGKGGFGEVSIYYDLENKRTYAIKQINIKDNDNQNISEFLSNDEYMREKESYSY